MTAKKAKFYVVWRGHQVGIFESWEMCKKQIEGFMGAQYKSYTSRAQAELAFQRGYEHRDEYLGETDSNLLVGGPIYPSWAVDAACNMRTGVMEYRGVDTRTRQIIFAQGPFEDTTNNVGEFLAIVHALALLQRAGNAEALHLPIYSDSTTALSWVRKQMANTKMAATERNAPLRELIARAETWLRSNTWQNPLLKWDTQQWGEIPADYGRK